MADIGRIFFGPGPDGAGGWRDTTVEPPRRRGTSRLVVQDGQVVRESRTVYEDEQFIGGTSRFAAVQNEDE